MARELEEVSPEEDIIIHLVNTRPVSHRRSYIVRHVLRPLLEGEVKESLPNINDSRYKLTLNVVVHYLHDTYKPSHNKI